MNSLKHSYKLNKSAQNLATYINKTPIENNIVIFSDPRGGSTWLAESVRDILNIPVLWEPLYLKDPENTHFKRIGFGWRQEIPVGTEWPEAHAAFEKLFQGKILSNWTTRISPAVEFLTSNHQIVKFCRANGMAKWLTATFNLRYRPIVLLRHPFAVAASQLGYGAWSHVPEKFDIPNMPFNERYYEHAKFLQTISSKPERLVAQWCLTNGPLLHSSHYNNFIFVLYEDLLRYPQQTLSYMLKEWNFDVATDFVTLARRPSSTVNQAEGLQVGEAQLGKWRNVFDTETTKSLTRILEYFGIDIYSDDIWPKRGMLME